MATYTKRGTAWRAEVRKKGHRLSSSFATKAQAVDWATRTEAEIMDGRVRRVVTGKSVGDAFERYAREVSPSKRGALREIPRLVALGRTPLARLPLCGLTTQHLADFRDCRLGQVSGSTVNRELTLISAVFGKARKEWGWMVESPISDLDRPRMPPPRDRLISDDEITRITLALGYRVDGPVETTMQLVGLFFLLAIETGMRLGEMCGMTHASVHLDKQYIQLDLTKNGDSRQVPLSTRALALCRQFLEADRRVSAACASVLFRRARRCAGIKDLHFHDTRHEAITRLSRRVDVLALARIVGHRDLKSLMTYYNESASELAARLG